jgi:uncharacterized protein YjdB
MKKKMKHMKRADGAYLYRWGIVVLVSLLGAVCMSAQSPYIHKVYDFRPAPGQFVNVLPEYEPGDTKEDMIRKVEEYIAGEHHNEGMISLGGYGGYIVFGFDHLVENKPGKYDFKIWANAFYANANPNQGASREGGSCEPGIVMVSYDANDNGIPDDEWYELAGSEYRKPQTIRNYRITYYKPDENKEKTPDYSYPYLNDTTYVRWTTNGHGDGYLYRNTFHNQSYYPQWIADETLTFEGTKLANNYVDESGQGKYYVQYAYHWGYADNHPNNDHRSGFNVEWAVDAAGNSVQLPGIHFIKVYTGVNQYCGWLGETSTEIVGAEDLHITGNDADVPIFANGIALDHTAVTVRPGSTAQLTATISPSNATNKNVTWKSLSKEVATVEEGLVSALTEGTAVIQAISNDGYYIASCTVTVASPTGIEQTADGNARVYYTAGMLYLLHMEGYACTVVTITGQQAAAFRVDSPDDVRQLPLPKGIYILTAQKEGQRITFKLISK